MGNSSIEPRPKIGRKKRVHLSPKFGDEIGEYVEIFCRTTRGYRYLLLRPTDKREEEPNVRKIGSQYRINLSEHLRYLGVDVGDTLAVISNGQDIEIWPANLFDEYALKSSELILRPIGSI